MVLCNISNQQEAKPEIEIPTQPETFGQSDSTINPRLKQMYKSAHTDGRERRESETEIESLRETLRARETERERGREKRRKTHEDRKRDRTILQAKIRRNNKEKKKRQERERERERERDSQSERVPAWPRDEAAACRT